MKKLLKTALSLLMITLLSFNFTNVQAAPMSTSDDWISQALSDYEPLQSLIKEYPDIKMVENNTNYILNETKRDKNGEIVEVNKKEFLNESDLDKYLEKIKKEKIKEGKKVEEKKTEQYQYI